MKISRTGSKAGGAGSPTKDVFMSSRIFGLIAADLLLALAAAGAALAQNTRGDMEHDLGFLARICAHLARTAGAVWDVLATTPQIPAELTRTFTAILLSAPAELPPVLPLTVAAAVASLVLAMPRLLQLAGGQRLERWLAAETRFGRVSRLVVFDLAALLVSVALALALLNLVFRLEFLIGMFAVTLV